MSNYKIEVTCECGEKLHITDDAEEDVETFTGQWCSNCESEVFLKYEIEKQEHIFINQQHDT